MNWMRKFVIDNIGLLLSSDDRTETIRMIKKEFFHRNSLKSSDSFTLKELALDTLKYLVDISRIRSEDDLRKYKQSSGFLSSYVTEHDMDVLLGLIMPPRTTILTPGDLGKLAEEDFIRRKEEEFLEKAKKIAEEEFEKGHKRLMEESQVEQKRLEELRSSVEKRLEEVRKMESLLDSLPSTINPEEYVSPEEQKQKELARSPTWWQRIGLTGDPFPTKLGLDRIPENKYEEVVVATDIFRDYVKLIRELPQTLYGKTILITGQFGAGKTTFLQYISYKLGAQKILPFRLVLDPVGDIDVLRQNFYSEIFSSICRVMRQRGLVDPRPNGASPDKATIADLLSSLSKESQVDGFVIMIDGLHKAESTLDTSLEFVKQLQNFHEYLNNCSLNVCIFVTGSPLWLRKVTQNPAYSGSFNRIDEVPTINFGVAYELLQKRIKAFSSQDVPVYFDKATIEFAYNCLSTDLGKNVTFRSFIDYILPRLERGDLKEAGISVSVDMEDVRKIDKELGISAIKDSYEYFREITKDRSKLKRACATALRSIYRKSYLGEQDQRFLTNKGAFIVLRNAHLIQKTVTGRGLGWAISNDFLAVLEDLNEQGYSPPVVFHALSIDPTVQETTTLEVDPVLNAGQDFLAKWESEWPEIVPHVKNFLENHRKIIEYYSSNTAADLCQDCRIALTDLIQCAQLIFSDKQSPEEWLRSTWLDVPILGVIFSVLRQEDLSGTEAIEYYQRYHQSVAVLLEKIGQLLEINRLINIIPSRNGRDEIRTLFNAGNYLQNGDFEKAIEEIGSSIEKRIRVAFHLAFSLHFGNDYMRHLPADVQERITGLSNRAPYPLKRSVDQNLFYHLSRSEYANVVNEKSNWSSMFEKLFYPKTREEVFEALRSMFAVDDRKQHRDRPEYFRERREQIRQDICNADWLLYSLANVLRLAANPTGFIDALQDEYHNVRVSFAGPDQCVSSYLWKIHISKEKEIMNRLMNMSKNISFSDDIAISTLFNATFAEIFIVLAILNKNKQIEIQDMSESRMYLRLIPKKQ